MENSVGVIGVGIMGSAMARNLMARGFDVSCYDVQAERVDPLVSLGATACSSPGAVAARSSILITSLPSAAALSTVVVGSGGLATTSSQGLVVVETSTLPLDAKEQARAALASSGIALLDCPISGTGQQAREGDIVLYASGDRAAFDAAARIFGAIGRDAYFLGEFGAGSKMKYIANLLAAVHNLAAAEALLLARKAGLDLGTVEKMIVAGAGTSRVFELRAPLMVEGAYVPATATIDTTRKDVGIIADFAASVGCLTPLLTAAAPFYAEASTRGRGQGMLPPCTHYSVSCRGKQLQVSSRGDPVLRERTRSGRFLRASTSSRRHVDTVQPAGIALVACEAAAEFGDEG